MKIIEFFNSDKAEHWLSELKKCDWSAGSFLYELLCNGELKQKTGENTRVLMLTEKDKLISFCTLADMDDIQPTELTPWIGFVYTFPGYRGHRYAGILLEYAEKTAKADGQKQVYISTNHTGLYEKYGYEFYKMMKDIDGEDSRVYIKHL